MNLRTGVVILPDLSWEQARVTWREAEQRGFHTAWTYDHLSWRSLRDGPWHGAVPMLAAAAEMTETIRLGTLVATPNFRHPALLAKDVMTLDNISGGRFDLGLGAGGTGWDATALGSEAPTLRERASRFDDFTAALDVLLREPTGSYAGPVYQAPEYRTLPGCVQRPRVPFTIAAIGPKALGVAVEHGDCWVTFGPLGQKRARTGTRTCRSSRTGSTASVATPAVLPTPSGAWCSWRSKRPGPTAPARDGTTSPPASRRWASPTSSSTGRARVAPTCPAATPPSSRPSPPRSDAAASKRRFCRCRHIRVDRSDRARILTRYPG